MVTQPQLQPTQHPQQQLRPRGGELLAHFLGSDVTVSFLDGKAMNGVLLDVTQYELLLRISDGHAVVMKHAVKRVSAKKDIEHGGD